MATQPLPPDEDPRDTAPLSHVPANAGAPVEALVSGTVGDRCVNCGSLLSSDQRYCVVCGERRGAPRFSLPANAAARETAPASSSPPKPPRSARLDSGTKLIAGVATLLLAVLVGVLIGHNAAGGGTKTISAGPTKIIKVGGAAAPASTTPATSTPATPTTGSASSGGSSSGSAKKGKSGGSSGGKSKTASKPPSAQDKKSATAQQQAASKVLGGSNTPPATVTVGQQGSGSGFNKKTHKFDGSFFGG